MNTDREPVVMRDQFGHFQTNADLTMARQAVLNQLVWCAGLDYPAADIRNLTGAYEILYQLA
jgi:hypothetical protein